MSHFVRRFLIAAHYRARGNRTLEHLAQLEKSQWLSRDEMLALQTRKLKEILVHCGGKIPFYRERFSAAGFDPARVRGAEDLRRLPVLTRDDIRLNAERMIDPDTRVSERVRNATGGSSGTPVEFFIDRDYSEKKVAHIYRNFRWCGWELGDGHAFIWGADVDSTEHSGVTGGLRDALYNTEYCNAFGIDPTGLDRFLERLARKPPNLLVGYASSLDELERRAQETGRTVHVRAIISSAEVLSPALRERLTRTFAAQVFDRYGAREVGTIGFECEMHQGLHTIDEANVVEIEGGPEGQVLVTNLNNRTMPLVRYRLGDSAECMEGACACGRGLGRMSAVRGRIGEYLVAPSGKRVHGEFFTHLFYCSRGVRQFEVVQTSPVELVVRIVRAPDYETGFEARLSSLIREHGDPAFKVRFEFPDAIDPLRSGKRRFVRREIAP